MPAANKGHYNGPVPFMYHDRGKLQCVIYSPIAGTISSAAPLPTPRGREMQRDLSNGLTDREPDFADNQIQSMATPTGETFTFAYDASKKTVS